MVKSVGLVLLVMMAGCSKDDEDSLNDSASNELSTAERSFGDFVEAGYAVEVPPSPSDEQLLLYEMKWGRRQVANRMRMEVVEAAVPFVVVASLFVVDGAVDLLLNIVPVDKLGDAARAAKRVFEAKRQRRSKQAVDALVGEFDALIDPRTRQFLKLASKLTAEQRRALRYIHRQTGSEKASVTLLRRQLDFQADVQWIAEKLRARAVDGEFIKRFTFDGDFIREYTEHSASPSWAALQRVVDGDRLVEGTRGSLVSKVKGLLGEQAAARRVAEADFAVKHLGRMAERMKMWRGVRYGGSTRSVDIVAMVDDRLLLVGEVKNWASTTWSSQSERARLLRQLGRHNEGVKEMATETYSHSTVAARVLLVVRDGFIDGLTGAQGNVFRAKVKQLGWTIELIPGDRVMSFPALIDELRK
ncbi:MAG: hypothetical protein AAGC55_00280 [Myxococcota bacterium]